MNNEKKIPTNYGLLNEEEIFDVLRYGSYEANRSLHGMSHDALVRLGIGNDKFKEKYESIIRSK